MSMKKIVIADDEPGIIELLRSEFAENGYEVFTAVTGKECLEKIYAGNPDLVILDVMMPDLNGSEVAKVLRADPNFKDLPIVFLTGLLSKDDEKKTGNDIANLVIFAKPFSVVKLIEKVREILDARDLMAIRNRVIKHPLNSRK